MRGRNFVDLVAFPPKKFPKKKYTTKKNAKVFGDFFSFEFYRKEKFWLMSLKLSLKTAEIGSSMT